MLGRSHQQIKQILFSFVSDHWFSGMKCFMVQWKSALFTSSHSLTGNVLVQLGNYVQAKCRAPSRRVLATNHPQTLFLRRCTTRSTSTGSHTYSLHALPGHWRGAAVVKCCESQSDEAAEEMGYANHLIAHMLPWRKWIWLMLMVGRLINLWAACSRQWETRQSAVVFISKLAAALFIKRCKECNLICHLL